MRRSARLLTLALLLLLPRVSAASILDITIHEPLGLAFGPWGAHFQADRFEEIFLDGVPLDFEGEVEFQAGPLLSLTLYSDPDYTYSLYEYGPGTFTLTARWNDNFGSQQGSFVAPLLTLSVDLCEQVLSLGDCGDVFDESQGSGFATFGPGLFDSNLAHALRINQEGLLSPFLFDLDGVTGDPSDNFRDSGSPSGREQLEIFVSVPEPSALSLVLLSAVAVLGSRRMRRRVVTRF